MASLAGTAGLVAPVDVVPVSVSVGVLAGAGLDAPDASDAPDEVPEPEGEVVLDSLLAAAPLSPPPPPHAATKTVAASTSGRKISRSEMDFRLFRTQPLKKFTLKKLNELFSVMRMMSKLIPMSAAASLPKEKRFRQCDEKRPPPDASGANRTKAKCNRASPMREFRDGGQDT
ncbi:hypothetical protein [Caballeronia hypogeia]|uniref:hypothetical protein n=1 Tax=Caballeronia hypogeia TaxID=1777140 RepID=UPI0012FD548E|nr:hypothetical protein [Caballeronia hypogeia]